MDLELNLDKIHTLKTKRSNCYKPCHIIYHRDLSVAVKDATAASLIKKLQQEFPKFTFKIISYYPTSLIQARKIGVRCFIRAERAFVFDELEQITRQLNVTQMNCRFERVYKVINLNQLLNKSSMVV